VLLQIRLVLNRTKLVQLGRFCEGSGKQHCRFLG